MVFNPIESFGCYIVSAIVNLITASVILVIIAVIGQSMLKRLPPPPVDRTKKSIFILDIRGLKWHVCVSPGFPPLRCAIDNMHF